jgi:predicted dehydrogenase
MTPSPPPASPSGPSPLRIGLAGLGHFGRQHAAVLGDLAGVELAALCDPDPEALRPLLERHTGARGYSSFEALIADPALDAIVIVTPEPLHLEHGLAALASGRPVFLEKPMAASVAEAEQLQQAALAAGVPLQIGLVLRYETSHALLRQEIVSGRFGDLVSIRVKRNCSRPWAAHHLDRVPTVHETLIHDLDLMLWLGGSPAKQVMAMERQPAAHAHSEAVTALIRFRSGTLGLAESSWFVPAQAPVNVAAGAWHGTIDAELEVVGTLRTARLRLLDSPLQIWSDQHCEAVETGLWPLLHGTIRGALRDQLADFAACVREGRPSRIASLEDAVEGLRIAEAIVGSAATGQPVLLDPARAGFSPPAGCAASRRSFRGSAAAG